MAKLEIRYFTGDVEERELTRTQPISVGRKASNDVCIDEDDVAAMHCRIAWNKDGGYEVTAAGTEGVEVNGTLVQHARLAEEDVLRVGTVDLVVIMDESERAAVEAAASKTRKKESSANVAVPVAAAPSLPDELFEDDDSDSAVSAEAIEDAEEDEPAEELDEDDYEEEVEAEAVDEPEPEPERKSQKLSVAARIRRRLHENSARPGEREIIRSKFLIGLVTLMIVLLLASAVIWVWMQLNVNETLYEDAAALQEEGKYQQAIDVYDQLLAKPRNKYTDRAFFGRAKARVEQYIEGSAPNWRLGLDAAKEFERENREREGYADHTPTLGGYAVKIAEGAAEKARRTKDRKYLPIAVEARNFARKFSPDDEFEQRFRDLYRRAENAVVRQEKFKETEAGIKEALAAEDVSTALQLRLDFLKFLRKKASPQPLPEEQTVLAKLLKQTLKTEKERTFLVPMEKKRPAAVEPRPERARKPLALTLNSRPPDGRTIDRSRVVVGLAKQSCYGLIADSGEPVWRRAVGYDTPFFPIVVEVGKPSLLLYDTRFSELVLLDRMTGELTWRQRLPKDPDVSEQLSGPPLIHLGRIYVPTLSANLYQIDLKSGEILAQMSFSQKVLAPPVLAPDGERLILAGDKAVVYTIKLDPQPACESVSYVGHFSGSVSAPLRRIGKLVLMCENDRVDSCRLRVLDTSDEKNWLQELTFDEPGKQIRVDGLVRDKPVLRSNKLFVTSSGERVTVFNVSDNTELPEAERDEFQFLRPVASPPNEPTDYSGPVYLKAGPNDEFWMVTDKLRKLQLKTRVITPRTTQDTAFGRATQPPQFYGNEIFVGRQTDFSTAVTISIHNRQAMDAGRWSTVLGAEIIAWNHTPGQPLICLTEAGHVFRVSPERIAAGGFGAQTGVQTGMPDGVKLGVQLPLPDGLQQPIRGIALPDGRIAALCGGGEPTVWLINADGRSLQSHPIRKPPEADPVVLGDGLVVPMESRLHFIPLKPGVSPVGDYEAPFVKEGQPPRWKQLAALNDSELVAFDSNGRLRRLQLRNSGSKRHFQVAVEVEIDKPSGYGFAVHEGNVILADAQGTIQVLNPTTLQPSANLKTKQPLSNTPWVVGGLLFTEVGGRKVIGYRFEDGLAKAWEFSLTSRAGIAGVPKPVNGSLVLAERDGRLHWINPADGNSVKTHHLAEPIAGPPRVFGTELIVPVADGSLFSVKGMQ